MLNVGAIDHNSYKIQRKANNISFNGGEFKGRDAHAKAFDAAQKHIDRLINDGQSPVVVLDLERTICATLNPDYYVTPERRKFPQSDVPFVFKDGAKEFLDYLKSRKIPFYIVTGVRQTSEFTQYIKEKLAVEGFDPASLENFKGIRYIHSTIEAETTQLPGNSLYLYEYGAKKYLVERDSKDIDFLAIQDSHKGSPIVYIGDEIVTDFPGKEEEMKRDGAIYRRLIRHEPFASTDSDERFGEDGNCFYINWTAREKRIY